eukprot:7296011-Alexandrium_andersonii.AAC.1
MGFGTSRCLKSSRWACTTPAPEMYVPRRGARHRSASRGPEGGWPRAASKPETSAAARRVSAPRKAGTAAPRPSAPRKAGNGFCNRSMLEIFPAGPAPHPRLK